MNAAERPFSGRIQMGIEIKVICNLVTGVIAIVEWRL